MYALILYIALHNGQIVEVNLSNRFTQKLTSKSQCEYRRFRLSLGSAVEDIIRKTPYNTFTDLTIGTDYDNYTTKCKDVTE